MARTKTSTRTPSAQRSTAARATRRSSHSKAVTERLVAPVATNSGGTRRRSTEPRAEVVTRSARLASAQHSRGIHTEHHGRSDSERYPSGTAKGTTSTSFLFGRAKGIPAQQHAQLRDAGAIK